MTGRYQRTILILIACVIALAVAPRLRASGPDLRPEPTFTTRSPAFRLAYSVGDLGVVKPTFETRSLVQAYRVLNGRPPVVQGALRQWERPDFRYAAPPHDRFWDAVARVVSDPRPQIFSMRSSADFVTFVNCNDATWDSALRTLNARIDRYGGGSREVQDWVRAQIAVLRNCNGKEVILPEPAPAWADATLRADREYQLASAYFYATRYDEAAQRFLAIGRDTGSSWRPYGRYLAARSMIRQATLGTDPQWTTLLSRAENELRQVLADRNALPLHRSTTGLIHFVAARLRPLERLREVSSRLSSAAAPTDEDFDDYAWLLNNVDVPEDVLAGDDLTDWILAARAEKGASADRAVSRWRQTKSLAWLVAALWTIPPQHPATREVLDAASAVPSTSAGFATATVFRLRLLIAQGADADARRLLASLPTRTTAAFNDEALNVVRAARFRLARTVTEFLDNARRNSLIEKDVSRDLSVSVKPAFDDDAAVIFSTRLPLDRLVQAAISTQLPARLRIRLAQVSFTRGVVLRRHDAALRVAPVLAQLAPSLRRDLSAYLSAADDASRHRAGLMLLLRTPGMRLAVEGLENDWPTTADEPARGYRAFEGYWWCRADVEPRSELTAFLFGNAFPSPDFLSPSERVDAERELGLLTQASEARAYLAAEAIRWARTVPADPAAAEALARAVRGWRYSGCLDYGQKSPLPQRAFALLHRLYPRSEWARRTKYWYQ